MAKQTSTDKQIGPEPTYNAYPFDDNSYPHPVPPPRRHNFAPSGPYTSNHEQVTLASTGNLILGLWLLAAPFVLTYAAGHARANDIILGIIVGTIAAIRVFGAYREAWLSWINALAGLWLILAPFILGYSGRALPMWNDIIVGVLVAALAVWSALATHGIPRSRYPNRAA